MSIFEYTGQEIERKTFCVNCFCLFFCFLVKPIPVDIVLDASPVSLTFDKESIDFIFFLFFFFFFSFFLVDFFLFFFFLSFFYLLIITIDRFYIALVSTIEHAQCASCVLSAYGYYLTVSINHPTLT